MKSFSRGVLFVSFLSSAISFAQTDRSGLCQSIPQAMLNQSVSLKDLCLGYDDVTLDQLKIRLVAKKTVLSIAYPKALNEGSILFPLTERGDAPSQTPPYDCYLSKFLELEQYTNHYALGHYLLAKGDALTIVSEEQSPLNTSQAELACYYSWRATVSGSVPRKIVTLRELKQSIGDRFSVQVIAVTQ